MALANLMRRIGSTRSVHREPVPGLSCRLGSWNSFLANSQPSQPQAVPVFFPVAQADTPQHR